MLSGNFLASHMAHRAARSINCKQLPFLDAEYRIACCIRYSYGDRDFFHPPSRFLKLQPPSLGINYAYLGTNYTWQEPMPRKLILIVEDNHQSRQLLALVLTRAGYDITEAATGLDAIDQAHAKHPDLIIMDLGLPGITGDEAMQRLKADVATKHIPVVVNTAFDRRSMPVKRAMAAGAAKILFKPTPLKTFEQVAHQVLAASSEPTDERNYQ